jgi:hypothetical protein
MPRRKSNLVFGQEVFFNVVYLVICLLCSAYLFRLLKSGQFALVLAIGMLLSYLLLPTFTVYGAGSRYRLPVEGIIVYMAFLELVALLKLGAVRPQPQLKEAFQDGGLF